MMQGRFDCLILEGVTEITRDELMLWFQYNRWRTELLAKFKDHWDKHTRSTGIIPNLVPLLIGERAGGRYLVIWDGTDDLDGGEKWLRSIEEEFSKT
jgi:hypothetical protein